VRTIFQLEISKEAETICFVIRANAFLHHMVRNLVGTLVYVGKGKHKPEWMREVLASKDRNKAAPTFGPEGLYLEKVEYEPRWGLPQ
jgi:tRNA pseudouridine38-40 synthase